MIGLWLIATLGVGVSTFLISGLALSILRGATEFRGFGVKKAENPVQYWINIGLLAIGVATVSLITIVFAFTAMANAGFLGTDF